MRYNTTRPMAFALLRGGKEAPGLIGAVRFYQLPEGVKVQTRVTGLPKNSTGIYGFHIHEGGSCAGEAFALTGNHYDRLERSHPNHAGDLPPLFSYGGRAWFSVITDRFSIPEIIGRTVVIHSRADDFTSQPAGNAGEKIACGVIMRTP